MSMGAGVSSQLALGGVDSNIASGEQESASGTIESISRRAFIAPGLSPWLAGRLGLGSGNEAGLGFTGRSLRLDGRHAFEFDRYALSVGLGASSLLARRTDTGGSQGEGVLGFGVDLPILFGWQSRAEIVSLWVGARPGYERLGNFGVEPDPMAEAPASTLADAYQVTASGLLGLSVGLHPVWIAVELQATQHWVRASERIEDTAGGPDTEVDAHFEAFSLAPAGAVRLRF
jgi:hypothetical protein